VTDKVDLIVLDWDGGEALVSCLQSINAQTVKPSKLIIVDNGSTTPTVQRLPKNLIEVPYVILRNETNQGFTGGINRGMSEVKAPFVGWINNDAALSEKWIEKLAPVVGGEGKIAGAQSIIMLDKQTVDGAGIMIDGGTFRQIGHRQKLTSLRQVSQPWGISATAALFRTVALNDVALHGQILRSDFFAYYEDVELCARLRAKGWRFKIVPEALTMHRGSYSAGRLGLVGFRLRVRNRYFVARTHKGVGEVGKLFREDMTLASRELIGGHFRYVMNRFRGILDGFKPQRPGVARRG